MSEPKNQRDDERERRNAEYKRQYPMAFPSLDDKQLAIIEEFAQCKTYRDGEYLFRAGDTEFKFHVIKRGRVEIVDRSSGTAHTILVHEPGEFTGDLANLAGRASNVDAIALGEVGVYEICKPNLQHIISERPNLSELILQTFIARSRALNEREDFTGSARHRLAVFAGHFSHPRFSVQKPRSLYLDQRRNRRSGRRVTATVPHSARRNSCRELRRRLDVAQPDQQRTGRENRSQKRP